MTSHHATPDAPHDPKVPLLPPSEAVLSPAEAHAFFRENGYLVARQLIPREFCGPVLDAFRGEIKAHDGALLRQTTTKNEKHNLNAFGHMTNPLLDIHELDPEQFGQFVPAVLRVVAHENLFGAHANLMAEAPVLVQTMYFESSRGTDPHIDSPFLDSTEFGKLIGTWIALEDIDEEAGRFFVYPRSNQLYDGNSFAPEINALAQEYLTVLVRLIQDYQLEGKRFSLQRVTQSQKLFTELMAKSQLKPHAPEMRAGDVIFFASGTIHGSFAPGSQGRTRNSITAHFVPRSKGFLRFHKVPEPFNIKTIDEACLHHAGLSQNAG